MTVDKNKNYIEKYYFVNLERLWSQNLRIRPEYRS